MKIGEKKAHGWKIMEASGELFRINFDVEPNHIKLWAVNLKTNYHI